jgi:hypothetical protein
MSNPISTLARAKLFHFFVARSSTIFLLAAADNTFKMKA